MPAASSPTAASRAEVRSCERSARELAQIAHHQHEAEQRALLVAQRRGRERHGNGAVRGRELALLRAERDLGLERGRRGGASARKRSRTSAIGTPSRSARLALATRTRPSGVARATPSGSDSRISRAKLLGVEHREAEAVHAPRDRRAEHRERGDAEARHVDAEDRQQPVRDGSEHERNADAGAEPAPLAGLGRRRLALRSPRTARGCRPSRSSTVPKYQSAVARTDAIREAPGDRLDACEHPVDAEPGLGPDEQAAPPLRARRGTAARAGRPRHLRVSCARNRCRHSGPTAIQPGAEARTSHSAVAASGASVQSASQTPQCVPPASSAAAQRLAVESGSRSQIATPQPRQTSAATSGNRK